MQIKKTAIFLLFILSINQTVQANENDSTLFNKKRFSLILGGSIALYSTALLGLNQLWYADFPHSDFHFFNDNAEWKQFDKVGHFATAYYESLFGIQAFKWTGMNDKKAILFGSLYGFIFQTPIEILDGFSSNWGASLGDIIANTLGSATVLSQFLWWNEQRFCLKYSFHRTPYALLRPDVLGKGLQEEFLKDYNGATVWLSCSLNSFFHENNKIPGWLAISFGYGAEEMLAGRPEDIPDHLKHLNYIPYRQFYFALDINPQKIKTNKKLLKFIFSTISVIKFPAPALEFNKHGVRFHPLYF